MCAVLEVSESGYHAWKKRLPSKKAVMDAGLTAQIRRAHRDSLGIYGAPTIHRELRENGVRVGRKRVARIMRTCRLAGVTARRFCVTTRPGKEVVPTPDLVKGRFATDGPNKLWVADITYIPTWSGFLYLSVVLDVWSRKIVGWAMAAHMQTELVLSALDMALSQRRPDGVVHHSDRGSQYTSIAFGKHCVANNVQPSRGAVGNAYDNAMCESFFATLDRELLERKPLRSLVEARSEIFQYIEGWYNKRRRHSSLDYVSPANFEARYMTAV
jgi:putative transposase